MSKGVAAAAAGATVALSAGVAPGCSVLANTGDGTNVVVVVAGGVSPMVHVPHIIGQFWRTASPVMTSSHFPLFSDTHSAGSPWPLHSAVVVVVVVAVVVVGAVVVVVVVGGVCVAVDVSVDKSVAVGVVVSVAVPVDVSVEVAVTVDVAVEA